MFATQTRLLNTFSHNIKIVLKIVRELLDLDLGKSRLGQHLFRFFLSPHGTTLWLLSMKLPATP
jgi:hypothetical protein